MSRPPGPTKSDPFSLSFPPRTPGSLGCRDAGDPNCDTELGDTPGPLGVNDCADPQYTQRVPSPSAGMAIPLRMLESMILASAPTLQNFDDMRAQQLRRQLGVGDKESLDGPSLEVAIELFRASKDSTTATGKAVLDTLDDLRKRGKITFGTLSSGLEGESNTTQKTITMAKYLVSDPAKCSIWLVHEAYHLAGVDTGLYIDEEIHSRELQAQYSKTISQGIQYKGNTYKADGGELVAYYQRNQLIDWVLKMYGDDKTFLPQGWIAQHYRDSGGPSNRTAATKKLFVEKLARDPEKSSPDYKAAVAEALVAILKSCEMSDASMLIKTAGDGNLDDGMERIRSRIAPITGSGPTATKLSEILAWQKRTGFDLGFKGDAKP